MILYAAAAVLGVAALILAAIAGTWVPAAIVIAGWAIIGTSAAIRTRKR